MPAKKRDTVTYQLKVQLKHSKPPIWRRLQVSGDTTLYKLHQIIQTSMGWTNSHLHQFIADGVYYGEPHPDYGFDMENETRYLLRQLVSDVKDKFIYEYDFGDGWEHEIIVEKLMEPEPQTGYPRCIKGKRACPPEDVGGVWGYDEFLVAIQNKKHPEHKMYLDWIGGSFDPEDFDLDEVNQELRYIR